jgi:ubiquinone biosynthesis protein UbiJ
MRIPVIAGPINHLLRANSWARERLLPHAGRVVRIDNPPFSLWMAVTADGAIADAAADATPDVTVGLTPGLMLRLVARDASAWHAVRVEGNPEFAAAINYIVRNLRWDIEEDLSKIVGDIAAHRLVDSGRKLGTWGQQSADNLARSFAEYWTEERPLIASRAEVEQFVRDVDALRDDLARVEKRIELRERVNESTSERVKASQG